MSPAIVVIGCHECWATHAIPAAHIIITLGGSSCHATWLCTARGEWRHTPCTWDHAHVLIAAGALHAGPHPAEPAPLGLIPLRPLEVRRLLDEIDSGDLDRAYEALVDRERRP